MGTGEIVAVGALVVVICCCSSISSLSVASKYISKYPPIVATVQDTATVQPQPSSWHAVDAKPETSTKTKAPTFGKKTATPKSPQKKTNKGTSAPAPPPVAVPAPAPVVAPAVGGASLGTFGATFYSYQSNGDNATGAFTSPLTPGRSVAISGKASSLKPKQTYLMKRGGATSCVSVDDKCAGGGCSDIDIYTGHDHAAALAGGRTTVELFDTRC